MRMVEEDKERDERNCALFVLQTKQRELEEARRKNKELQEKLKGFPQRQVELRQKIKEARNSHSTEEMSLKRREADRAVEKAEKEEREVLQRKAQIEELKEGVAQLTNRNQDLQGQVGQTTVYMDFMNQAVKFTKFEDTEVLIHHFQKLLHFREQLYQKETEVQDKQGQQRRTLQQLEEQHKLLVPLKNSELSKLQAELDGTRSEAATWERRWKHIRETAAKKTLELGRIRMATLNLYEKTGGKLGGEDGVDMQDTEEQLERIKVFLLDESDVLKRCLEQNPDKTRKPFKEKRT